MRGTSSSGGDGTPNATWLGGMPFRRHKEQGSTRHEKSGPPTYGGGPGGEWLLPLWLFTRSVGEGQSIRARLELTQRGREVGARRIDRDRTPPRGADRYRHRRQTQAACNDRLPGDALSLLDHCDRTVALGVLRIDGPVEPVGDDGRNDLPASVAGCGERDGDPSRRSLHGLSEPAERLPFT